MSQRWLTAIRMSPRYGWSGIRRLCLPHLGALSVRGHPMRGSPSPLPPHLFFALPLPTRAGPCVLPKARAPPPPFPKGPHLTPPPPPPRPSIATFEQFVERPAHNNDETAAERWMLGYCGGVFSIAQELTPPQCGWCAIVERVFHCARVLP